MYGKRDWRKEASCAQTGGEDFFAERGGMAPTLVALTKRVCGSCPVRVECLEWILEFEEVHDGGRWGVWGGTTPNERKAIAKARRPASPSAAAA